MGEKLVDVEICVRHILALNPQTRRNDKLLMLYFWRDVDGIDIPPEFWRAFLSKATHPETIRRTRQKIQSQGDYLPDEETLKRRQKNIEKFRQYSQMKLF
ncbi:MAG: hypothetical protein NZ932_04075 [Candidatus Bathyarchaeota archaeon]|nr:hypothetical protein [Candidatus Bathyarchaeota archaeon]MDW8022353.1 hypothetical protein [Nitrososphaerota archaeon]